MEVDGEVDSDTDPFALRALHVYDSRADAVLLVGKVFGAVLYRASAAEGCASFRLSGGGASGNNLSWGLAVLEAVAYAVKPVPIVQLLWECIAPIVTSSGEQDFSVFTKVRGAQAATSASHAPLKLTEHHPALLLFIYALRSSRPSVFS